MAEAKTIKMETKNEDGKKIVKAIPENLVSLYKMQGWEVVKDKPSKLNEMFNREENNG